MAGTNTIAQLAERLRAARIAAQIKPSDLERQLLLGPGWVSRFETGRSVPNLEMLLMILATLGVKAPKFFDGLEAPQSPAAAKRQLYADEDGDDLLVRFPYSQYDATYRLKDARLHEFELIVQELQDGLARQSSQDMSERTVKANAIADAFLSSVKTWPHANPSDLWWFIVYRAYCDWLNHPSDFARMDLAQSWKRAAGWALEQVLVRHYASHLASHGINIFAGTGSRRAALLSQLEVSERLEPDKVDVLLTGEIGGEERCFGVVHVKSSFAERRTDDVPLSRMLIRAGYLSPLWTMDCKSSPSANPFNRGELGAVAESGRRRRSAKRKDIEDDGYFSACFSYNLNTVPTPREQAAQARIVTCDFRRANDRFSHFVVEGWEEFRKRVD